MATFEKRKTKNGVSVKAIVRVSGFPVRRKTFKRLTDAKLWAQQMEVSMHKGGFIDADKESKKHTVSSLISIYISSVLFEKSKKTQKTEEGFLKWWSSEIGNYALSQVTPTMLTEKINFLKAEPSRRGKEDSDTFKPAKSRRTIKAYRDSLDRAFKKAVQWRWIAKNPFDEVDRITKLRNERVRFLDDDERARLLEACKNSYNSDLYLIVVFALSTGARKSEVMRLKWRDVDLERGFAVLRNTKNGETRSVPIASHLLDMMVAKLEKEGLHKNKLLFPRKDGEEPLDIRKSWEKAIKESEVENFTFHDLRHSAASYLAMNGATLSEIAAVLGHKTLQMVKRYAHISELHAADVVAKMNDKIFKDEK